MAVAAALQARSLSGEVPDMALVASYEAPSADQRSLAVAAAVLPQHHLDYTWTEVGARPVLQVLAHDALMVMGGTPGG